MKIKKSLEGNSSCENKNENKEGKEAKKEKDNNDPLVRENEEVRRKENKES